MMWTLSNWRVHKHYAAVKNEKITLRHSWNFTILIPNIQCGVEITGKL